MNKRFENAIEWLYDTNHYLAAEVTKLGYPKLDRSIPTAGVYWDKHKNKLMFIFNPDFAEKLTDEQFAYVVSHEAFHVLHLHVFLLKTKFDEMKKSGKSNIEISQFQRRFNIAADCVVNDSLSFIYDLPTFKYLGWMEFSVKKPTTLQDICTSLKFDNLDDVLDMNPDISSVTAKLKKGQRVKIPSKIYYGPDTVGVECWDLTVEDVLNLFPKDKSKQMDQDGDGVENHPWDSFFDESGNLNREFVDAIKDIIKDNMENSFLSDEEQEMLEDMKEGMEQCSDAYASKAGSEALGAKRPIDNLTKDAINWNRILFKLTNSNKSTERWDKLNNQLVSVYPDVVLPYIEDEEKEDIFVAIDSSGSISMKALTLFVSILKNTPRKFNIKSISFDNKCYEYDVRKGGRPPGGGGTSFDIIERYLQNLKKYPKAVFVLTDGDGNNVDPQYPDRWVWLLYGYCTDYYCKNMKTYKIEDLLK